MLQSMNYQREGLSLSGLASEMIGLGGWNQDTLKICEKYLVSVNKWVGLPPLNTPRQWPGSILLNSKRAFCFCGGLDEDEDLNSV